MQKAKNVIAAIVTGWGSLAASGAPAQEPLADWQHAVAPDAINAARGIEQPAPCRTFGWSHEWLEDDALALDPGDAWVTLAACRTETARSWRLSDDEPPALGAAERTPAPAPAPTPAPTPASASAAAARDAASSAGAPSIQYLMGGKGGIPGGTYALKRRAAAYQEAYLQPNVLGPLGLEFSYLNEGHLTTTWPWYWPVNLPLHYRDSYALQLDAWTPSLARCRLGAALGPEAYFDTTTSGYRTHYEDRHGVGLRTSVSGQCYLLSTLAIQVLAGRSFNVASYDSNVLMFGLTFTPGNGATPGSGGGALHGYVDLAAGMTGIDSFRVEHEQGIAEWLTYGHPLSRLFALELSALNEGISGTMQRRAAAAQLMISHTFGAPWLRLFAGLGPELARTSEQVNGACDGWAPDCDKTTQHIYTQMNLLYTYGVRAAIGRTLSVLLKIGRVQSSSGRTDTDLAMLGVGVDLH